MVFAVIHINSNTRYFMKKADYVQNLFYLLHCKDRIPKNSKQIFPGKELRGYSPNFYIHVSVSDSYIPLIGRLVLPILPQENMRTDPENI
jgi:hypothetical protein